MTGRIKDFYDNSQSTAALMLFNNNMFDGPLPDLSRPEFSGLVAVGCEDNFMTGSIPTSIGRLSKLVALYCQNNLIDGAIPSDIQNIKEIEIIDVSLNLLDEPLFDVTEGSLPQLNFLLLLYLFLFLQLFELLILLFLGFL